MVSNMFKNCLSLSSKFSGLSLGPKWSEIGVRNLYSLSSLGVDNYIKTRERVSLQYKDILQNFKMKMDGFCKNDSNSMIFTEDLKNMVHLVESNKEDLELIEAMLLKFCQQNKEMRFGSFIFGPVVMRMYHHLNKPHEAVKIFKSPEMNGFFDQLISFQILLDLMFKNEMYPEMLEIFNMISDKQLQGSKYPKNSVVLVLAACYKMNNQESFNFAKKLWSKLNEIGHYPMRRAGTFAAALAINQNSPEVALEILTSMKQQSYVTIRNLKVAALSDLGRADDTFPILKSVLEVDTSMNESKHTFSEEIIAKVLSAIDKTNKQELKDEFKRIEHQLRSLGFVSNVPIDSLLCKEIEVQHAFEKREQNAYPRKRVINSRNQYQRPSLRSMV